LTLRAGDRLRLCSDGLTSYTPAHLVSSALSASGRPDAVAESLIALALEHGGRDNVTVVIVDVVDASGSMHHAAMHHV
jgi:protein phosphatase